jgi:tetratricopeptide (TPR) repeat protein/CHAT domain-containing protein
MSMRRKTVWILALIVAAPAATPADLSPATLDEAGVRGLEVLIDGCVKRGGLRIVPGPGPAGHHLEVADADRLFEGVALNILLLKQSVREALIARGRRDRADAPAVAALLRTIGRVTQDDRASGWAALLAAREAARLRHLPEAAREAFEAVRRGLAIASRTLRDRQLDELVARCAEAGGLKVVDGPGPGGRHIELGDLEKLAGAIAKQRALLNPTLRDALIERKGQRSEAETPALVALLRSIGAATGDDRASAFAAMFAAEQAALRGEMAVALAEHQEAARRFAAIGDAAREALCYDSIGMVYQVAQGKFGPALNAYRRALEVRLRSIHGPDLTIASSLNSIGYMYLRLGDYEQAVDHYDRALSMFATLGMADHPIVAVPLNNLGNVRQNRFEFAKALDAYRRALAIKRKAFGDGHPEVAFTLTNIGTVLADQGDNEGALEHYRRALAIQEPVLGPQDWRVATTHNNIGSALSYLGRYREALQEHDRALAIRQKYYGPEHAEVASSYANLASVHQERGDYDRALDLAERALTIRRKVLGAGHPDVAATFALKGSIERDRGDVGRALVDYERALAIRRAVFGDRHPTVGASLNIIGLIRLDQGEAAEGYGLFQKARELQATTYGERHPEVATIHANLGDALARLGWTGEAVAEYRRALEIRRSIFGDDHPSVASSLNGLGCFQARRGDDAEAEKSFRRALEIWRARHGARHPDVALAQYNLAGVLTRAGRSDEAVSAFDGALGALGVAAEGGWISFEDATPERLRPLPLTVEVLRQRGAALEAVARPSDLPRLRACARSYELAAVVLERARRETIRSESGRLIVAEESFDLFPSLIGVRRRLFASGASPDDLLRAFDVAERGMARVFLESLGTAHARDIGGIGADLRAREESLARRLGDLERQFTEESSRTAGRRDFERVERLADERRAAEEESNRFVAGLERDFPQYAALKYPRSCTVAEARECLADDEVALIYVPGSRASYLLVLDRPSEPGAAGVSIHELPPAEALSELVASLTNRKTLTDDESARELGSLGHRILLDPVAGVIRGKHLVIVAGGVLGQLPFELLVASDPGSASEGRYLVERHRIRYAPSLTALRLVRLWERTRTRPTRPLWAIGDPSFQPSDVRPGRPAGQDGGAGSEGRRSPVIPRAEKLGRLEGSGAEVERLRDILGAEPDEVLVGPAATEFALKYASASGRLARYRFVHFATHGLLGQSDGAPASLVFSLAVDQRGEDGFLQLHEVTGLKLNADLVVLSACRTGQGRVRSAEGVSSLARSFLYAGSRGVLCSLWPVDDQATVELMAELYSGLKAGLPSVDALREAQRKMIADGEPPLH